jgi:vancomycin permeability regulator SanA
MGDPADVAVVLGCKVHADGTPSPKLRSRLQRALEVWQAGQAPVLIVSGDGAAKEGVDEAAVMKAWLVERGVPAGAVIEDGSGVNTRATARFTVSWMKANSAHSVIAVSQYFHLPRIRLALSQEGLADVRTAGADRFTPRDARLLLREAAAYLKYLIRLG